jgi:sigma-E factor negative regulatory protein RseA
MKQNISELMDGELFDDEAEALLDRLKRHPEAQQEWHTYHLISDVLRQPSHTHINVSIALRERLQAEPTVLAPRNRAGQNARWFALSAAASVMALTLVAWMSVQVSSQPSPQMALQKQQISPVRAASAQRVLDEYLMAHQEFSPSNDVQGAASYIRTVAENRTVTEK